MVFTRLFSGIVFLFILFCFLGYGTTKPNKYIRFPQGLLNSLVA